MIPGIPENPGHDAPLFPVLHEDPEILVLHKPAGLVCHPSKGDALSSLIGRLRLHCGDNLCPEMVHRLDRETSGVMVVAKTHDAALELRQLWSAGFVTKEYLAIVHGDPPRDEDVIDAPLGRDEASAVAVKDRVRPDGARAWTRFRVERRFQRQGNRYSLLRLRIDSGRKHQIRIHLAHAGHPIVGDKLYGGDEGLYLAFVKRSLTLPQKAGLLLVNQALHAARLWFPWKGAELCFESPPESPFLAFLSGAPLPEWREPFDPAVAQHPPSPALPG